jgi:hypothetical protein
MGQIIKLDTGLKFTSTVYIAYIFVLTDIAEQWGVACNPPHGVNKN